MHKHRAIPQGYMTVGTVSKKMNVTVRTLQYYDKLGLLPPATESEGGLRLYTHKEIVKLHQIQAMKRLGFSLEEIKAWLPAQNTPEEVSAILVEQASDIREKIQAMSEMLDSIEKLNAQVLQTKCVDWEQYADILKLLQSRSELYWAYRHLSDDIGEAFDKVDEKTTDALVRRQSQLLEEVDRFQQNGILPESEQAQVFAREFWDIIMELTGGDDKLLTELMETAVAHGDDNWKSKQAFISKALNLHLTSLGNNVFRRTQNNDNNNGK